MLLTRQLLEDDMTATTLTLSPTDLTGTYALDPAHTRIGFSARHAMVTKVRGAFNEFEGGAELDFDDPTKSSAHLVIKTASVDTRNEQRDNHLRTNDFFDAPNYPTISFVSTSVRRTGDETFELVGDLTIKDVTKSVTLNLEFTGAAKDPFGNTRVGFEGGTTIERSDYGVKFNAALETGGLLVSEKVTIELELAAIRQA
jgi:polyisoprenoid-binding protein YceI